MLSKKATNIIVILGTLSLFITAGYTIYSYKYDQDYLFEKPAINKQKALELARTFLGNLGFNTGNYPVKHIAYRSRNLDTLYLLKKYGYKKVRQLIHKENLPYAYWSCSWSGVGSESLLVSIDSQNGRIISYVFWHYPSSEEKILNLKEGEAKNFTEKFLAGQGIDISQYELINMNKNTLGLQEEYHYKWSRKNFVLGEANYVINVAVKADKVASYSLDLELPKSFKYEFENSNFVSRFWINLSMGLNVLLTIILIVLAILKRKILNWKLARLWAGVLGIIFLINFFNEPANYVFYMDIISKIITTVFFSLIALILIAVVEVYFKEGFGKEIFINKNRETIVSSILICYSITFISFVLVSAFYESLRHFKIIWDVGIDDTAGDIFTSKIMYLAPFLIGIIPAFLEEFFRGFTIAFFKRISKSTFIAVIFSAFLWGFGHTVTDGSFYPGYFVGIEKFIDGIIIGCVILYLGIEAAILWHFLNNFLVTNIFFVFLGGHFIVYSLFSSILILIPFFVALYFYNRKPAINVNLSG